MNVTAISSPRLVARWERTRLPRQRSAVRRHRLTVSHTKHWAGVLVVAEPAQRSAGRQDGVRRVMNYFRMAATTGQQAPAARHRTDRWTISPQTDTYSGESPAPGGKNTCGPTVHSQVAQRSGQDRRESTGSIRSSASGLDIPCKSAVRLTRPRLGQTSILLVNPARCPVL